MTLLPTKPAEAAFQRAAESVAELGHEAVEPEHLLMGLLSLQAGSASAAMDAVGVDRALLQSRLISSLSRGVGGERQKEYRYSPAGLATVERAMTAAQATRRKSLTSAQVMLAVLGHRPIIELLERCGVPVVRLLQALQKRSERSE